MYYRVDVVERMYYRVDVVERMYQRVDVVKRMYYRHVVKMIMKMIGIKYQSCTHACEQNSCGRKYRQSHCLSYSYGFPYLILPFVIILYFQKVYLTVTKTRNITINIQMQCPRRSHGITFIRYAQSQSWNNLHQIRSKLVME